MENKFDFCIPLQKGIETDLIGVASTISVDRDEERMSERALKMMVSDIKTLGVNLFGNHEHNWENTLGVINDADLSGSQVNVKITLDDANTNPKVPALLNKLNKGIKLGLSIGGQVTSERWEHSKELGKKIKVIDGVKLLEVSVVGIPSNADAFVSIPQAIHKSAYKGRMGTETIEEWESICHYCGAKLSNMSYADIKSVSYTHLTLPTIYSV